MKASRFKKSKLVQVSQLFHKQLIQASSSVTLMLFNHTL
uniref:Uncharacterized protein n=1 Tax=Anguilla anguilla TaxID=7936 RepID=A0A0E9QR08_ANGAN